MNNFLSFQVHGAHKANEGISSILIEVLTFLESLIGLSPAEIFNIILPGISAIANVHPLLVHFPIAFLFSFFIIDLIGSLLKNESWRRLAGGLLYLGTIAAAATVTAGIMAANSVEHGENVHLILARHQTLGFSVLSLSVILSLWRIIKGGLIKGISNILYLLLATLLTILMILGADLGSLMVYKYGVAVEAVELTVEDYFHEHSHDDSHTHTH